MVDIQGMYLCGRRERPEGGGQSASVRTSRHALLPIPDPSVTLLNDHYDRMTGEAQKILSSHFVPVGGGPNQGPRDSRKEPPKKSDADN